MTQATRKELALADAGKDVLQELIRRVEDIDNSYRAIAEKMGKLYMCADENKVDGMLRSLDKPMRNASENEQSFAEILKELRRHASQAS